MAGVANRVGEWKIFKSTTFSGGADWAMTLPKIWWLFVHHATKKLIGGHLDEKIPFSRFTRFLRSILQNATGSEFGRQLERCREVIAVIRNTRSNGDEQRKKSVIKQDSPPAHSDKENLMGGGGGNNRSASTDRPNIFG
jgi:hypothetical protein